MAIKSFTGTLNVVEAARIRIQNIFDTGLPVWISMSGGKDSICMIHIIYSMIREGKIDPKQVTVIFIDEEAIFDDIERIVLGWRKKLLALGVSFNWYCVQVKHYNCLRTLSQEESFITWDEWEKDNWIREMPPFAIKHHPLLKERIDTYQDFMERIAANFGIISVIGVRASESTQRRSYLSIVFSKNHDGQIAGSMKAFPIYDWKDDDVWLYIKENKLDFPETYMYMYQTGSSRREMRISQFFSIDTAKILVKLSEMYPELMEKVQKREPGAYLAALYWDSEMFRRKDKNAKSERIEIDWKKKTMEKLEEIQIVFKGDKDKELLCHRVMNLMIKFGAIIDNKKYQDLYNILVAGDPKQRTIRAFYTSIQIGLRKGAEK
ncbi:MAG: phosphoadenosine phosphosulfate reductase family protein [Syntrophorhabdaceae bacterium]|nr:phosphoadenosine phosphosulfate reductase family protein [Syntrophorhabdaceae bacterium]